MPNSKLFEEELQKVDDYFDRLAEIVADDGRISEEEQALLDEIRKHLQEYRLLIIDVTLDDDISSEEEDRMHQFRENIVEAAKKIALEDDKYTEDEWKVIESLKNFAETS